MTPPLSIFASPVFTVKFVGLAAVEVDEADVDDIVPFPATESLIAMAMAEGYWLNEKLVNL